MLIPVRCFSCGKPISHLYETYMTELEKTKKQMGEEMEMIPVVHSKIADGFQAPEEIVLDQLGIKRQCCRRMFLTNVDFTDVI